MEISLFFRPPVLVVEAMYKSAKLTAKAAKMANKAASVGTPSSQWCPPCPDAAAARSEKWNHLSNVLVINEVKIRLFRVPRC